MLAGFAIVGAVLGALQVASAGSAAVTPFPSKHSSYGIGLFTNRNHQADFLLIAMLMVAALGRIATIDKPRAHVRLLAAGAIGLFAAGIVATASRAGFALAIVVLPLALLILFPFRIPWRRALAIGAGLVVLAVLALGNSAVRTVIDRFSSTSDPRFGYWSDMIPAIRGHGPLGSGFGTFESIYRSVESLSNVGRTYANQAHNDYLQLALEGGVPAVLAIGLFILLLGWTAARLRRPDGGSRRARILALGAVAGIMVILLHSIVDYPLRMMALATVFALLCGFLVRPPAEAAGTSRESAARAPIGIALRASACVAGAGVLLHYTVSGGVAGQAVRSGDQSTAERYAARSSDAASWSAAQEFNGGDPRSAEKLAMRALARSPLDARAITVLGLVRERQGRERDAASLINAAAAGGWREVSVQLWLIARALQVGQYPVAAQRADALLRQNLLVARIVPLLRDLAIEPGGRAAIAARLAENPGWRRRYLEDLGALTPVQRDAHEALLGSLAGTAAPATPREVDALVARHVAAREYGRARDLWLRAAREPGAALLSDGSFARLAASGNERASPFAWQLLDVAGASATPVAKRGGGVALRVQAGASAAGIVMRQMLALPPGQYRFSVRAAAPDTAWTKALNWMVRCVADRAWPVPQRARNIGKATGSELTIEFGIPSWCDAQELELHASGAGGSVADVQFDNARLKGL